MSEVMDMTVVSCDGKNATADITVWSEALKKPVDVRVRYTRGDDTLEVEPSADSASEIFVMTSQAVLQDVKEALEDQRAANRQRN